MTHLCLFLPNSSELKRGKKEQILQNQAGQKRKAALQAEKDGNKEGYTELWAESRELYDDADRPVDAYWKPVAMRKKGLEEKLRDLTPVSEPSGRDIYLIRVEEILI